LIKKGEKILEIGCGKGKMLNTLLEKGYSICGVDLNEEYIMEMKNIYKRDLPVTHVKDYLLPFSDNSFDKVISFDVLEHIPNTKGHLSEVSRVLKKNGKYCFGIPNRLTDEPFCIWSGKSFTKYKKPGGHCSLQTYWSIKKNLERNGFEVKFYKQKQNTKWIRNKVFRHFGTNGLRLFNFLRIDKWPIWLKPTIYVTGEKV
jgi:cyclopropane fatty-acyl-phospholipid synthase-like methyltransferase